MSEPDLAVSRTPMDQHLAWAKARALAYLDAGDVSAAAASLISDLRKHLGTWPSPAIIRTATLAALNGDAVGFRRWIVALRIGPEDLGSDTVTAGAGRG